MKKISLLILFVFAALLVFKSNVIATDGSPKTGPVIKFETETHDFGDVTKGEKVTYVFKFTNVGDEPLILTNVRPSCGCTTPSWTKEPIQPGDTGEIKAQYDSTNQNKGRFHRSIRVHSNSTENATTSLFIKGEVK